MKYTILVKLGELNEYARRKDWLNVGVVKGQEMVFLPYGDTKAVYKNIHCVVFLTPSGNVVKVFLNRILGIIDIQVQSGVREEVREELEVC